MGNLMRSRQLKYLICHQYARIRAESPMQVNGFHVTGRGVKSHDEKSNIGTALAATVRLLSLSWCGLLSSAPSTGSLAQPPRRETLDDSIVLRRHLNEGHPGAGKYQLRTHHQRAVRRTPGIYVE